MTSVSLSQSEAATSIISSWKGFKVRKIFSTLEKVNSWEEYHDQWKVFDKEISKDPAFQQFLLAWEAALLKTDNRIWKSGRPCSCVNCKIIESEFWTYPEDDEPSDGGGDWMWNEGGYNDW